MIGMQHTCLSTGPYIICKASRSSQHSMRAFLRGGIQMKGTMRQARSCKWCEPRALGTHAPHTTSAPFIRYAERRAAPTVCRSEMGDQVAMVQGDPSSFQHVQRACPAPSASANACPTATAPE
jgi:hypothetical protein